MLQTENTVRDIFRLVDKLYKKKPSKFIAGKTKVQYAGSYYDEREVKAMLEVIFRGWFGLAWQGSLMERELAMFTGTKSAILTNSGSSASLLSDLFF